MSREQFDAAAQRALADIEAIERENPKISQAIRSTARLSAILADDLYGPPPPPPGGELDHAPAG